MTWGWGVGWSKERITVDIAILIIVPKSSFVFARQEQARLDQQRLVRERESERETEAARSERGRQIG